VFVVAAVDDTGVLNIVDVHKGRWDSLEIIEEFFALQTKYHPEWFAMERGTIEKSLGPVLKAEMLTRRNFIRFELSTANKDKQTRARGIQARIRASGIKFNKTAHWYPELEDEMVRFPKARHDDQVDALAWLGLTFDQVQATQTLEEEEEEDYQQSIRGQESGRSTYTGY
jgi:predicted phage terminase large subunit-like protein